MSNRLTTLEDKLLQDSDLSLQYLRQSIEKIQSHQLDFSDIFLQKMSLEYWQLLIKSSID